jgi:hypothetical protein
MNWEAYYRILIALPAQASRVLSQAERGELIMQSPQVSREVQKLTRSVDRLTGGIVFLGLLIGGILLYNAGNLMYGQAMLCGALLSLLWVLFFRGGNNKTTRQAPPALSSCKFG